MLTKEQKYEAIWWLRAKFEGWLEKEVRRNPQRWYGWEKELKRFFRELEVEVLKEEK